MPQKIEGCLELRLSLFLLFLCPADACKFHLISSFWDQVLISSLTLGRARFSLYHLSGWSTAVRDLQCEGVWGPLGPKPHHKWKGAGGDDLCREDLCPRRQVLVSRSGGILYVPWLSDLVACDTGSKATQHLAIWNPLNCSVCMWAYLEQHLQTVLIAFSWRCFCMCHFTPLSANSYECSTWLWSCWMSWEWFW